MRSERVYGQIFYPIRVIPYLLSIFLIVQQFHVSLSKSEYVWPNISKCKRYSIFQYKYKEY